MKDTEANKSSQNEPLNPVSRDLNTQVVTTILFRMYIFSLELFGSNLPCYDELQTCYLR